MLNTFATRCMVLSSSFMVQQGLGCRGHVLGLRGQCIEALVRSYHSCVYWFVKNGMLILTLGKYVGLSRDLGVPLGDCFQTVFRNSHLGTGACAWNHAGISILHTDCSGWSP